MPGSISAVSVRLLFADSTKIAKNLDRIQVESFQISDIGRSTRPTHWNKLNPLFSSRIRSAFSTPSKFVFILPKILQFL